MADDLGIDLAKLNTKKNRLAFRASSYVAWATVISFFVLWVFAGISKTLDDWTWFARSGSVLVAIGIFVTGFELRQKIQQSDLPKAFSSQTIILEIAIMVVGTLVWGFGDLIGLLY